VFAAGLVGSGAFAPDPMAGFPPGEQGDGATTSGLLHLAFGAVQFVALAAACVVLGRRDAPGAPGGGRHARFSTVCGVVVLVGFVGGAALSQASVGVLLLWAAVLASFGWLAVTSVVQYRAVPHPDLHRRVPAAGATSG